MTESCDLLPREGGWPINNLIARAVRLFRMKKMRALKSLSLITLSLLTMNIAARKQFGVGSSIQWVIDLQERYRNGIFCRKVEAYLIKGYTATADDTPPTGAATDFMIKSKSVVVHVASTTMQHPDLSEPFQTEVEVGSRYKLNWVVNRALNGEFHFQLVCLHPGTAKYTSEAVKRVSRSILAFSEPFSLIKTESDQGERLTYLKDISPVQLYEEDHFECPITRTRMSHPVSDGFHTFDAAALDDYLKRQTRGVLMCPYKHPLKKLAVDEQMIAKSQKFSEDLIERFISGEMWCFTEQEASETDLETRAINKLTFDMGTVSIGEQQDGNIVLMRTHFHRWVKDLGDRKLKRVARKKEALLQLVIIMAGCAVGLYFSKTFNKYKIMLNAVLLALKQLKSLAASFGMPLEHIIPSDDQITEAYLNFSRVSLFFGILLFIYAVCSDMRQESIEIQYGRAVRRGIESEQNREMDQRELRNELNRIRDYMHGPAPRYD